MSRVQNKSLSSVSSFKVTIVTLAKKVLHFEIWVDVLCLRKFKVTETFKMAPNTFYNRKTISYSFCDALVF